MLHSKAVATQDTIGWKTACKAATNLDGKAACRLGTPFPEDGTPVDEAKGDEEGWKYNCYVNPKIDHYLVPRLEDKLKDLIPEIAERLKKGKDGSAIGMATPRLTAA